MINRNIDRKRARGDRSGHRLPVLGALAILATLLPSALRAAVYLNEVTVCPAGASDTVELYNSGPAIDVTGWRVVGTKGLFTFPAGSVVPAGGYLPKLVGDILHEGGGVTSLIDVVKDGRRAVVDAVSYGTAGSAPLPPQGTSLARAPDASVGVPPTPDPAADGLVWTISFTPTFGWTNDAPQPELGGSVVLNEFDPAPIGGGDPVELVNRTDFPVNLSGWTMVNGDAWIPVFGIVPPHGVAVLSIGSGFDLETAGLIYLFRGDGTRVDQLGFHDAPPLQSGSCFRRCPDGSPPYLGYNYTSSGGSVTLTQGPCTLGAINCDPTSVPEPGVPEPDYKITSWGRIRVRFR
jgi:hypothetical protein